MGEEIAGPVLRDNPDAPRGSAANSTLPAQQSAAQHSAAQGQGAQGLARVRALPTHAMLASTSSFMRKPSWPLGHPLPLSMVAALQSKHAAMGRATATEKRQLGQGEAACMRQLASSSRPPPMATPSSISCPLCTAAGPSLPSPFPSTVPSTAATPHQPKCLAVRTPNRRLEGRSSHAQAPEGGGQRGGRRLQQQRRARPGPGGSGRSSVLPSTSRTILAHSRQQLLQYCSRGVAPPPEGRNSHGWARWAAQAMLAATLCAHVGAQSQPVA